MSTQEHHSAESQDAKAAHYCNAVESATLAALLQGLSSLDEVAELVPADFAWTPQQKIFQAMRATGAPDFASVSDYLKVRGQYEAVFADLLNTYNDPAGLSGIQPSWIRTIKACALRRSLWHTSQQLANLSLRSDLDTIEETHLMARRLANLADASEGQQETQAAPVQTLGDLIAGYWAQMAARKASAPTGLADLDTAIGGGFQPGKLVVLLGAPGSGKTTLANQIAEHIANAGRPVLYLTSEDTPATLLAKTLARLGNIHYGVALGGFASARQDIDLALSLLWERRSAERLTYVHDTGSISLERLQELARAHFARFAEAEQGGPGILVVDYLQRLARSLRRSGGRAEDLRESVTQLTEQLRAVALELDCTILALSSQNRSGYGNGASALASAKESGDIEYTADVILTLGEDEKGKAAPDHKAFSLRLVKNRLGTSGTTLALDWYGARQHFTGEQSQIRS